MNKRMVSFLLALTLCLGLLPTAALAASNADSGQPGLARGAWDVFEAECQWGRELILLSPEEVLSRYGADARNQYVNCINYYYDTNNSLAFTAAGLVLQNQRALTPEDGYEGPSGNWVTWYSRCGFLEHYTPVSQVQDASASYSSVSADAAKLYREAYRAAYPSDAYYTLDEFAAKFGGAEAAKYANCMNYFWDTGYATAVIAGHSRAVDGTWGFGYSFIESYVPGSQSSKAAALTSQPFPDVATNAWYAEAVAAMKYSGIIMGCDDGLFHPEREVTVGEFCVLLMRAGTPNGSNISGGLKPNSHWASGVVDMVETEYAAGFTSRVAVGKENDSMTRIDAAVLMHQLHERALTYNKRYKSHVEYPIAWVYHSKDVAVAERTLADIPDHADIEGYLRSDFDRDDLLDAYNKGIIKGVDTAGTFNSFGTLTRAEAAQMLYNAAFTKRYSAIDGKRGSGYGGGWRYDLESQENFIP